MTTTIASEHDMGLEEVSSILWRERHLLDLLLFKLEEEQLVLASGRTRFLNHATREVEVVLEEIRHAEVMRAMEVERLAGEMALGTAPTLRQIAGAAPPPWDVIFEEHRVAFVTAAAEVQTLAESNRELLNRGRQATEEALAWLSGGPARPDPQIYSASGSTAGPAGGPR